MLFVVVVFSVWFVVAVVVLAKHIQCRKPFCWFVLCLFSSALICSLVFMFVQVSFCSFGLCLCLFRSVSVCLVCVYVFFRSVSVCSVCVYVCSGQFLFVRLVFIFVQVSLCLFGLCLCLFRSVFVQSGIYTLGKKTCLLCAPSRMADVPPTFPLKPFQCSLY